VGRNLPLHFRWKVTDQFLGAGSAKSQYEQ
jgi:hypothetical protein